MTKKAIIKYVIKKVKEQGGRAFQGNICTLEDKNGWRCAFSLCLKDSVRKKILSDGFLGGITRLLINDYGDGDIDNMLLKKYRGHSYDFWFELQRWHDRDGNWEKDGNITAAGLDEVKYILKTRIQ